MAKATESTALAVRTEDSGEMQIAHSQALAKHEIESALVIAQRMPRDEAQAEQRIMRACSSPRFSAMVQYSYPRGSGENRQIIKGPTVKVARELARCWGNIRWGTDIIADDEETRTLRSWAWDLETNAKTSRDTTFKKLIYRKKGGWVKPDERDLRELSERMAAFAIRNCLLDVLPEELVALALETSQKTLEGKAAKDPTEARRQISEAFRTLGVSVKDLEQYLGHSLTQCSPAEIAELRPIYKSILDGQTKWVDYVSDEDEPEKKKPTGSIDELDAGKITPEKRQRPHGKVCSAVLAYIQDRPGCTVEQINAAMEDSPESLTLALDELCQAEMIQFDGVGYSVPGDEQGEAEPAEDETEKPEETPQEVQTETKPQKAAKVTTSGDELEAAIEAIEQADTVKAARAARKAAYAIKGIRDPELDRINTAFRAANARLSPAGGAL